MGDEQTADTTESTLTTPVENTFDAPPDGAAMVGGTTPTPAEAAPDVNLKVDKQPADVNLNVDEQPLIQIDPHEGCVWNADVQAWVPTPEPAPVDRTGQHWDVNSQQWLPDEVSL